jgi:hypothetical protein
MFSLVPVCVTMKVLLLAALVFCLALVGCGGNTLANLLGIGNSYSGTYTGTYSEPSIPQNGTVSLSIDQSGNLSGDVINSANDSTATIGGTINSSGTMTGTLTSTTTTLSFTGTLVAGTAVNGLVPYTANLTITSVAPNYASTWNLTQTQSTFSKRKQ